MLTKNSRVTYSPEWLASSGCKLSKSSLGTVQHIERFLGKVYASVTWDSGEVSILHVSALMEA